MSNEVIPIGEEIAKDNFFGFTCIGDLISNLVSVGLVVATVISFVLLVWGGVEWMTAGGDKAKTENAQKRITNAVIGLIIVATSWAVYTFVLSILGININDICSENPI